jgi:hypothetical protein
VHVITHIVKGAGRPFTREDQAFGPNRTIIVDDRLAKRVWGTESPIGKPLQLEPTGAPNMNATVVGVVEATRMLGLDGYGLPAIYSPYPPFLSADVRRPSAGEAPRLSREPARTLLAGEPLDRQQGPAVDGGHGRAAVAPAEEAFGPRVLSRSNLVLTARRVG